MNNKPDTDSFEEIVRKHQMLVFRTALGFVHVKEDAEDLTQEVFLRAYRHWRHFRGEAEVSTWLYRIAVNLSLSYVNTRRRKTLVQLGEELLRTLVNRGDGGRDPHRELERQETDRLIAKAMDDLPDKQRTAFVLARYDELSQKEIAGIMEITEGAVEQLLMRAKANLQKKLDKSIGKSNG